ncbi:beta strand repeat-containing protein [Haloferula chungangensis]|uniref:Beta strand repeat-containing protein n=1 Tax=Haloferula chungangensis TaxID=1048331 RepID=A0ABW2L231_9BACT
MKPSPFSIFRASGLAMLCGAAVPSISLADYVWPATDGTSNWDQNWENATVASANSPFNFLPAASVPDTVYLSDDQVVEVDSAIDIVAGEVIINDLSELSATLNINPGGSLTTGMVTLGLGSGEGYLNVQGGTLSASGITITANNPLNEVNVSSGTLNTGTITAGGGSFHVSGGTVNTSEDAPLTITEGEFNLSSGTVTLTDPMPGSGTFYLMGGSSTGPLNITGGSLIAAGSTAASETFAIRGTVNISGGILSAMVGNTFFSNNPVINVTGNDATIDFQILSINSAGRAGTFNFKFDSDGVSPINCATRIRLPNATITVDGSNYTGGPGVFPLIASGNVGNLVNDAPLSATIINPFPGLDADIKFQSNGLVVVLTEPITNASTWDGETDADWAVATNWAADLAPVADDTLFFSGVANTATNNNLTAGIPFKGINFTNSGNGEGFTLDGESIQLTGNINSTAVATPGVDAIVDTISLNMELKGDDRSIDLGANHDLAISGVISEDASPRELKKTGLGTLTLSGANSHTGGTTLSGGFLVVNSDGALGSGALTVAGGTIGNTSLGLVTLANPVTIGSAATYNSTSDLVMNGDMTLAGNFTISATTPDTTSWTLNGVISDGGNGYPLNKFGAGNLVVTNPANSFTGPISANNARNLRVSSIGMSGVNSAAGAGSLINVSNNATLSYIGTGDTTDRALNLGGGGSSALDNSGTGPLIFTGGSFTNTSTVAKNFFLRGTNADDNELDMVLTDSSNVGAFPLSVVKEGAGKWNLSGANTYTGSTTVNGGILALSAAADLSNATSVLINTGGVLDLAAGLNITVRSLALDNGAPLADGTYGSSTSGATNAGVADPDLYFTGAGILTVELGDPYVTWSGGAEFEADANGDGVSNGLAWILGATDPDANALGLLPVPVQTSGDLSMVFAQVNPMAPNKLFVEYSNDLGGSDPWHSVQVPTTSSTVDDITFTITPGSPSSSVSVSIPASKSSNGRLFSRLTATEN